MARSLSHCLHVGAHLALKKRLKKIRPCAARAARPAHGSSKRDELAAKTVLNRAVHTLLDATSWPRPGHENTMTQKSPGGTTYHDTHSGVQTFSHVTLERPLHLPSSRRRRRVPMSVRAGRCPRTTPSRWGAAAPQRGMSGAQRRTFTPFALPPLLLPLSSSPTTLDWPVRAQDREGHSAAPHRHAPPLGTPEFLVALSHRCLPYYVVHTYFFSLSAL